ncbi:MAG: indole-3-glycerol phosphate synthase TrpC [Chitinivibrionales bacterium]|nr:indole-3-glycerol phosphate synthase TrpC [Chitinivibrionales bacterium]
MSTILDTILEAKREEVAALRTSVTSFAPSSTAHRPFADALDRLPKMAIIAEVKKASPSKGVIRDDFDPVMIAAAYERAGASAISVLTDERFFQGSCDYLRAVRETVMLPVLRKDFIIDPLQVEQTAHIGADAMLLIAAALSDAQMAELAAAAAQYGIEPLIEVHNGAELERVMQLSPRVIGINNRDLATFTCDPRTTLELLPRIPPETIVVSESGIGGAHDTQRLRQAGARAVLVGESLMRRDDPAPLIRELANAGTD